MGVRSEKPVISHNILGVGSFWLFLGQDYGHKPADESHEHGFRQCRHG
jgi:hypothetical protein